MAPGVLFSALHLLAERTILEHLWAAGILTAGRRAGSGLAQAGSEGEAFKAATLDEMQAADLGAVFMPHGPYLGHPIRVYIFCPTRSKQKCKPRRALATAKISEIGDVCVLRVCICVQQAWGT
jgi:hypothetical protein